MLSVSLVKRTFALSFFALSLFAAAADAPLPDKIAYNRDIRPLLADACFKCHGFDKNKREADLRLDVRESALADLGGYAAIVPGKPDKSELWSRITATDEDEVMPPKKENHQLSAHDRALLRKWIEQGAEYQAHWAYLPPTRPLVPAALGVPSHPVDAFLAARQATLGLKFSAEADRPTLIRRLSFDLRGLPPTPVEVDAFVADTSTLAYDKLVDQYLASPHFGERMAVWWLDLVRFADTIGYHSDNPRNVWPYRDYVIRAFNENKRFDQFTIEQIAGDLLPDATNETRVASGYNRLILSTEEGGAQAKQYEAKHVTDRVKSIGTTWLAATTGCAECHDHKFDPITARDYYSLGAFFADIKEASIGRREDGMVVSTPEDDTRLAALTKSSADLQAQLEAPNPAVDAAQLAWEQMVLAEPTEVAWNILKPSAATGKSKLIVREDSTIKVEVADNPATDIYLLTLKLPQGATGLRLEALTSTSLPKDGPGRSTSGNFVLTEFALEKNGQPLKIAQAGASFEQKDFTAAKAIDGKREPKSKGWGITGNIGKESSLVVEFAAPLAEECEVVAHLVQEYGTNHTLGKFRLAATTTPAPIRAAKHSAPPEIVTLLKIATPQRTPAQQATVRTHFRAQAAELADLRTQLAAAQKARADFEKALPRMLISDSMPTPRTVRILPRGDWMNDKGEAVLPATPHFLPGALASTPEKRLTRLDLAHWLVSRDNPLTARVFVNRLWKHCFGTGICKTLEDLGTQGEVPVHQPLLDWLAVEFQDRGWDVKTMMRLLVTSQAYRQTSVPTKDLAARDPFNRELARQSRWRLDAEFVRDNALTVAGLLVPKIGGPSVKPYQPAGYWENLNFPAREWKNDQGPDLWRRGLYTWWQRSYVHPAMLAFDAPTREECAADRNRSNIPQQALVLLNDPEFVEAAKALAGRMLKEGGATPESRLAWGWKTATARVPQATELQPLQELLEKHRANFTVDPKSAAALLAVGAASAAVEPTDSAKAEFAAYTSVARVLLNLRNRYPPVDWWQTKVAAVTAARRSMVQARCPDRRAGCPRSPNQRFGGHHLTDHAQSSQVGSDLGSIIYAQPKRSPLLAGAVRPSFL
jgi:cytochrome c553